MIFLNIFPPSSFPLNFPKKNINKMPNVELKEILQETCNLLKLTHSIRKSETLDNIDTDMIFKSLKSEAKYVRVISTALLFLLTKNKKFLGILENKKLLLKDDKTRRYFLAVDDEMRVELLLGGVTKSEPKYPLKAFMYSLDLKTDQITGFSLKDFKEILSNREYHRLPDYTKCDILIWFQLKRKRFKVKKEGKRIDFYGTRNVSLSKKRSKSELPGTRASTKPKKTSIFQGAFVVKSAVKMINFGKLQPRRYFLKDKQGANNNQIRNRDKGSGEYSLENGNKKLGFLINGRSFFKKMDYLSPHKRAKSGKVTSKFEIFRKKKLGFLAKTNKIKNSTLFIRRLNNSRRRVRIQKTNEALSIKSRISYLRPKASKSPRKNLFFKKRGRMKRNAIGVKDKGQRLRGRRSRKGVRGRSRDLSSMRKTFAFGERGHESFAAAKYRQSFYQ